MNRISRTELYLETAKLFARRSSCLKKQVGCVIVKNKRIIATGYNGVLPGMPPSSGLDDDGNTHTVHAELNAIAFSARHGISLNESAIFCTLSPCEKCAEAIIQAGITKVFYLEQYRDTTGIELLTNQNIKVEQWKD